MRDEERKDSSDGDVLSTESCNDLPDGLFLVINFVLHDVLVDG